jgi:hypothetical protein
LRCSARPAGRRSKRRRPSAPTPSRQDDPVPRKGMARSAAELAIGSTGKHRRRRRPPARSRRRRSARQFRRGRDNRSRGMQSSRRRPGSAESGGAVSQDRASSRSSLRGRAGLAERASPTMGAGGGAGCASGEQQMRGHAWVKTCFRSCAGICPTASEISARSLEPAPSRPRRRVSQRMPRSARVPTRPRTQPSARVGSRW